MCLSGKCTRWCVYAFKLTMFNCAVCAFCLLPSPLLLSFYFILFWSIRNIKLELRISFCNYHISFQLCLVLKYTHANSFVSESNGTGELFDIRWKKLNLSYVTHRSGYSVLRLCNSEVSGSRDNSFIYKIMQIHSCFA